MTLHQSSTGEIAWRKSLSCESGACVTVARHGDAILLGNSSDPNGATNTYTRADWWVFVHGIKRGDFDDLT